MKKVILFAMVLTLSACDKSGSESKQANPAGDSGQSTTAAPAPTSAAPRADDPKAIARAALQAKFDGWIAGTDKDTVFQTPEFLGAKLLSYDIKAIIPGGPSPRSFTSTSTIEVETPTGSMKRQIRHGIIVTSDSQTEIIPKLD